MSLTTSGDHRIWSNHVDLRQPISILRDDFDDNTLNKSNSNGDWREAVSYNNLGEIQDAIKAEAAKMWSDILCSNKPSKTHDPKPFGQSSSPSVNLFFGVLFTLTCPTRKAHFFSSHLFTSLVLSFSDPSSDQIFSRLPSNDSWVRRGSIQRSTLSEFFTTSLARMMIFERNSALLFLLFPQTRNKLTLSHVIMTFGLLQSRFYHFPSLKWMMIAEGRRRKISGFNCVKSEDSNDRPHTISFFSSLSSLTSFIPILMSV